MSRHFQLVTLATPECADELALLHDSLRAFHPPSEVPLVVGCNTKLLECIFDGDDGDDENSSRDDDKQRRKKFASLRRDKHIDWIPCLDQYGPINRHKMESQRGVWYPTRHCDFMMEKANVMDWALQKMTPPPSSDNGNNSVLSKTTSASSVLPSGVLYVDSDITFLNSLSVMFPSSSSSPTSTSSLLVGASPHFIRPGDERMFGRYNGGMLFASHPLVLWHWRRATHTSRYFDQASIEDIVEELSHGQQQQQQQQQEGQPVSEQQVHLFGPEINYGFWRMFQSPRSIEHELRRFTINSNNNNNKNNGIFYQGKPLQSVHTHWFMPTQCREIGAFNALVKKWVKQVQASSPGAYAGLARILC